jgi:hypothetical protein
MMADERAVVGFDPGLWNLRTVPSPHVLHRRLWRAEADRRVTSDNCGDRGPASPEREYARGRGQATLAPPAQ